VLKKRLTDWGQQRGFEKDVKVDAEKERKKKCVMEERRVVE
jgi:hypothetical protein